MQSPCMQRVRRHGRFLAFSVPKGRLVAQRRLLRIWIPLLVSSSSATVRRRVEFCALRRNSSCAPLTHMCAVCVFVSGSWVHARRDWRRRMHGSRVGGGGVLRILIASYRRRGRTTSTGQTTHPILWLCSLTWNRRGDSSRRTHDAHAARARVRLRNGSTARMLTHARCTQPQR